LSAVLSAATTVAVGLSGRFTVPVALIATLAAMSAAQLMLSLRTRATAQALTTGVAGSAVTPGVAFAEPPNQRRAEQLRELAHRERTRDVIYCNREWSLSRLFSSAGPRPRRFVGLTGSDAAIEAAQRAAGLPPARKTARAGDDYAVGHANVVLAYTKDNLAHLMYPGGVTRQDWAHDLPRLVDETW